jgi:hypothetical protein
MRLPFIDTLIICSGIDYISNRYQPQKGDWLFFRFLKKVPVPFFADSFCKSVPVTLLPMPIPFLFFVNP